MSNLDEFEQWEVIKSLLPADWEQSARTCGALRRARGIADGATLLRLILLHTASGLSLKDASTRASLSGFCRLSAVALHGRLKVAGPWLRHICAQLLAESVDLSALEEQPHTWRIIDGSDIKEPGPTGSQWRLHYSLQLPDLQCDAFEITHFKEGETLGRWRVHPGEVIMADRGYCHRAGVAHVIDGGAEVLVRFQPVVFPLLQRNGQPFDLDHWLAQIASRRARQVKLQFQYNSTLYPIRLCAIRKSDGATQRGRYLVRQKARRNQSPPSEQALNWAGYTMVLTSLDDKTYSAKRILMIYRCRWQVELAFRRLKTLLKLGHLPKHDPDTSQAWLWGKLLAALLIQKTLRQAQLFSPWGYPLS